MGVMKTNLLLPALLAVAVLASGCVVVPRPAYGATYGYGTYNTYGYGYAPGVYVNRPGVYVSRPAARVVVQPGYGRGYGYGYGRSAGFVHGARPVGRGGRGHR